MPTVCPNIRKCWSHAFGAGEQRPAHLGRPGDLPPTPKQPGLPRRLLHRPVPLLRAGVFRQGPHTLSGTWLHLAEAGARRHLPNHRMTAVDPFLLAHHLTLGLIRGLQDVLSLGKDLGADQCVYCVGSPIQKKGGTVCMCKDTSRVGCLRRLLGAGHPVASGRGTGNWG